MSFVVKCMVGLVVNMWMVGLVDINELIFHVSVGHGRY